MKISGIFTAIRTNLSGLSSQMKRLDAISENVANAERVPDVNGKVYLRKIVDQKGLGKPQLPFGDEMTLRLKSSNSKHLNKAGVNSNYINKETDGSKIIEVKGEKLVFDPSHPRADEAGYVKMPKVNLVEEMVDLISASRAYEANVSILTAAKQMAKNTLKI